MDSNNAYLLYFDSGSGRVYDYGKYGGFAVRCLVK
jgi:hypothetical protein